MTQTVIGFFDNSSEANEAVSKLVSYGITRDRIDVSGRRNDSSDSNMTSSSDNTDRNDDNEDHENGITRFFKNLFGDNDDDNVNKYSRVASASESIVTVHTQTADEAHEAADIMDNCGAVNVDEKASEYGYAGAGTTSYNSGMGNEGMGMGNNQMGNASMSNESMGNNQMGNERMGMGNDRMGNENESQKLNVMEENLEVGKREVENGSVRLKSRIIERPVEETVRLREERVNVERRPVNRPASDADFNQFEEKDIEMVEHKEVPVVNKQARVVEEVSLNKEINEREETIHNTVRNTEVNVDRDSDHNETSRDRDF